MLTALQSGPCPREFCNGFLAENDGYADGELHCFICGKTAKQAKVRASEIRGTIKIQPEKKEEGIVKHEKVEKTRRNIRELLPQIAADMATMTTERVREKWGISSATIFQYQKAGLLPRKHKVVSQTATTAPTVASVTPVVMATRSDGLPAFPAFDAGWPQETQIEWLRAYRDLKLAGAK